MYMYVGSVARFAGFGQRVWGSLVFRSQLPPRLLWFPYPPPACLLRLASFDQVLRDGGHYGRGLRVRRARGGFGAAGHWAKSSKLEVITGFDSVPRVVEQNDRSWK